MNSGGILNLTYVDPTTGQNASSSPRELQHARVVYINGLPITSAKTVSYSTPAAQKRG
jgi:hypothetical protein